jgi:hypothetical protein
LFSGENFVSLNNFFYQGLIGLGIFFIIGNAFYYGRLFAGGDPTPKTGEVSVNLDDVFPTLGIIMNMQQRMAKLMGNERMEKVMGNDMLKNVLGQAWIPIQSYVAETALGSLGEVFSGQTNDPYAIESNLMEVIRRGIVPFMPKMSDDIMRQVLGNDKTVRYVPDGDLFSMARDTVKLRDWGMSNDDLPVRYGMFGEPAIKQGFIGRSSTDPVVIEMLQVMRQNNGETTAIPTKPRKTMTIEGEQVELSPSQYNEFLRITGQVRHTLYDETMKTPEYAKMSYKERQEALNKASTTGSDAVREYFKSLYLGDLLDQVVEKKVTNYKEIIEGRTTVKPPIGRDTQIEKLKESEDERLMEEFRLLKQFRELKKQKADY